MFIVDTIFTILDNTLTLESVPRNYYNDQTYQKLGTNIKQDGSLA